MSDGRIKDIDREVLATFVEEVADFLRYLRKETSVSRVRDQIKVLDESSRLVGALAISARASHTLAAIANAKYIDHRVAAEVRRLTEDVAWEAREASSLAALEFTEEAVELKVCDAEKP